MWSTCCSLNSCRLVVYRDSIWEHWYILIPEGIPDSCPTCSELAKNDYGWTYSPDPKQSKVKVSSYIAQYPVLRTAQSALHFTSLTDLFTQTPSRLLWEPSSHMLQLMREGCSYTYPPLSIVKYSFIQMSEPDQYRVKTVAQGFNTPEQDSNPGSCSRESDALALGHCTVNGEK